MSHSSMTDDIDAQQKFKEFLADGGQTAITVRIPANLRDAFKREAELRGLSFSAFLRMCMIQELSGKK